MRAAPSFLAAEARQVTVTRALRACALHDLLDQGKRRAAFAAAGVLPTAREEVEALGRMVIYWTRVAPQPARAVAA